MQTFPHRYSVTATGGANGDVVLESARLPLLRSAGPAEFGGPGDRWSPETLLVAAVADCFVLSFRTIAQISKVSWTSLTCDVTGTLDRVEGTAQFTEFVVRVRLRVPYGTNDVRARQVLEKAERSCLVANSLKGSAHLEADVEIAPAAA